ncbi:AmiS/UreI family transporter [Corynebacterium glutamicum]|uniref:Transporter n=1 Tax=Corynebacterium glutamicum (strain R) TaxID=340322 RepID=A0AB72VF90_CORGB|nr:AmiS/UreI family transporter [Corynebacterium glutamicum]BAQ21215.1 hypothetical protein cgR_6153 [Corynebacterium glutamicum R]
MSSLALSFGGAVLLVNGVTFIGVIQPRSEIPINLLAGGTLFLAAIPMVWTSIESSDTSASLYSAVGFALFGFTYLGVALGTSLSADNRGLGVYCGWAPVIAGLLVYVNATTLSDPTLSVLWASWVLLFVAFCIALTRTATFWSYAAGVLAVYQAFSTATIPALLLIHESPLALIQIAGALICVIALFRRQNQSKSLEPQRS